MKERDLITYITNLTVTNGKNVLQGIGDDCAVVEKTLSTAWLVTMDTLVESIHFDCAWHPPENLGRKAVSINVSDIAAMGGNPCFLLLSLALPQSFTEDWFYRFSQGMSSACSDYDCLLIGGDTVRSPEHISITLTVIGEAPKDKIIYRHSAKAGDVVLVTGHLGLAAAGLDLFSAGREMEDGVFAPLLKAHLDPKAQVYAGQQLAGSGLVNSMMDLSDGLATDLAHICNNSKLGAVLFANQLVAHPSLEKAAKILQRPLHHWMLSGGEDYQLLLTASPSAVDSLQALAGENGFSLTAVGKMVEGEGVRLVEPGRKSDADKGKDISYQGFDHFSS